MQIKDLNVSLVQNETDLNLYVKKAEDFGLELSKIQEVTKDNYEISKKLRSDIVSSKTSVEATRKIIKDPVIKLGKAIDDRAKVLAEPFADMQKQIQAKIDVFEKEEKDRKELEAKRIDGIVEKINTFTVLEELSEYYKSLEPNDQKRKAIMEAGTLIKNKIKADNKKQALDDIKKQIAIVDTLEGLKTLVVGEYGDEEEIKQAITARKERITFNIQQKKLKEEQDELNAKKEKEAEEKKEKEENLEKFKSHVDTLSLKELKSYSVIAEFGDMDKVAADNYKVSKINKLESEKMFNDKIEMIKERIGMIQNINELNNYFNSFIDDEEIEDAILDSYNSKKNELLEKIEKEKQAEIKTNEPAKKPVPIVEPDVMPGKMDLPEFHIDPASKEGDKTAYSANIVIEVSLNIESDKEITPEMIENIQQECIYNFNYDGEKNTCISSTEILGIKGE